MIGSIALCLTLTSPLSARRARPAKLSKNNSALFIIDVWNWHQCLPWYEIASQHTKKFVVPLRKACIDAGIPVYHFYHDRLPHPEIFPQARNEFLVAGPGDYKSAIISELKTQGVKNIFFCGYATNMCILKRPCGIASMRQAGFRTIIIKDATLGFSYKECSPEFLYRKGFKSWNFSKPAPLF